MNNIKFVCIFSGTLLSAALWSGCDENTTSSKNELELKCVDSGGVFENGHCVCNGGVCDENVVCDNGACSGQVTPPEENEAEKRCKESGGTYQENRCVCKGQTCDESVVCDKNGACSGQVTPPEESEAEKRCKESGGTYQENRCVCSGISCETNIVCDKDGKCSGNQEKQCEAGDQKCTENTAYECTQDAQWDKVESCENGCANDGKKCAECLESSCKDGVLIQCNDNVATTIECANGCNDAANDCKPECEVGQVKCNDKIRLECNPETHTWNMLETCAVACEFDGTDKTRCIDNCTDGETRCVDGKISTCENKVWTEPQSCPDNNQCADEKRCSECAILDPANPPRRCVNDPETGIGQIEVCNGSVYEIEKIPTDPSDPNSSLKKNICENGVSCKADAAECGECNISKPTICRNEIATDDGCTEVGTAGKVYSCEKGRLVLEQECLGDSNKILSCNADGTACGTCRNGNIDKCENDSKSVGQATICRNGEYIVDECERGLSCTGDGRSCKVCVYSSIDASNEKICNTCQAKSTFLLVCDENGRFVRQDCPSQGNMKTYCHLNSGQSYKAYCAQ